MKLVTKPKVVITSAFREFAAESDDLEILDYLVKPIPLLRFIKCINKIETEFSLKNNLKIELLRVDSHIFIKVDKQMVKIHIDEIRFVKV